MTQNPDSGPNASVTDPQSGGMNTQDVAKAQRMLIMTIPVAFGGSILMSTDALSGVLSILIRISIIAFSVWCVYKLCKALSVNPVFWSIAMLIPFVSLIALLVLNQKATSYLTSQGVKVGLLGAKV